MRKTRKRFTSILSLILALAMMATVAVLPASAATLSESQTSYGFFKSVGATQALNLLNNAPKRSYIKKGNPNSATSLTNMLNALKVIDETNKYRAQEGKSALKVTDSAMAMAQANADVSTVTGNHANQFSLSSYGYGHMARAENLAPYPDAASAVAAWYNEKYQAGNKGHYNNMVSSRYGEAGAAVSNLNQKVYIEDYQDANTNETKYTVSQYRSRLQNYINKVGSGNTANRSSNQNTNRNTNTSRNNTGTTYNNGIYSCTATTVVRQSNPTGTKSDYKDYRGLGGQYAVQNGKVIVYVQELKADDTFGVYADIRIINGTGKAIKLKNIPKLAIYSDDGLLCSGPRSIGYETNTTINPNGQCFIGNVKFNNVHANRNFTTGMLRVESTVTYTLA